MARRRFGRKGGRRYARRFARGARRGGSKMLGMFGFRRNGFSASNAVIMGGMLYGLVAPSTTQGASPITALTDATVPKIGDRVKNSAACLLYNGLGINMTGSTTMNTANSAIMAKAVGFGVGLKIAGKFINPMMSGSPVKL